MVGLIKIILFVLIFTNILNAQDSVKINNLNTDTFLISNPNEYAKNHPNQKYKLKSFIQNGRIYYIIILYKEED